MNNMRNKILSLLVLLLTAASGAWAQKQITITQGFEDGMGDWTMNHCQSGTGISCEYVGNEGSNYYFRFYYTLNYPQYLISPELDENDGGTMSFYYARKSSNYIESFKVGYSTTTSEPSAFTWGNEQTVSNGYGLTYFNYTYYFPAGTKYVSIACTSPDQLYLFIDDIKIEYVAAEPAPGTVTLNEAKTEASFAMPTFDVDVDYELVRDMAISMPVTVGDGNDGYRIRLKKSEQNPGKFAPAETDVAGMIAMIKVHDAIENQDLMFFSPGGSVDCTVSIYAIDDNDQPVGNPVAFQDLVPGRYIAKATAATGSTYDGETANSNVFVLFLGYPVEVPAGEFATFYKDEPLYADPISSADAELYTISSINNDKAVLSSAIETAPSNTPLLVYNNSDEAKTFLLIPADAEPNLSLDVYDGFIGTLTATTIAASDEDQTNYAFNGKAFVYVKYAIPVAANKAWLNISNSNARVINIVFDETTGVNAVERGTLTGDIYDLNGRKLQNMPTKKGIYIFNGKKVVVK